MKKIMLMFLSLILLSGCALFDYVENKVTQGQNFVVEKIKDIGNKSTEMFHSSLEKTKEEASNYLNKKTEEVKNNISEKIDGQKEELQEYIRDNLLPDLKNYLTEEIKNIINNYLENNNLKVDKNLSEEEKIDQYLKLIKDNPQLQGMVIEEIDSMIKK